jgi:hypothetical protein
MGIYANRLKQMQKTMTQQMDDYTPGGFSLLPEGEYTFRVQATLDETKKEPPRIMVVWKFTVAEGDAVGKSVFDRTIIEDNKTGAQICRGRLEDLGHEWPEEIVKLESLLEAVTANPPLVEGRVTHESSTGKDGTKYTNARIRITNVLDGIPGGDTVTPSEPQEAETDSNLSGLLAICGSYQLDYIDDSMDSSAIIAALKENGATFKAEDLQPDELAVLEAVDATLIEKPKPVTPTRKVVGKKK